MSVFLTEFSLYLGKRYHLCLGRALLKHEDTVKLILSSNPNIKQSCRKPWTLLCKGDTCSVIVLFQSILKGYLPGNEEHISVCQSITQVRQELKITWMPISSRVSRPKNEFISKAAHLSAAYVHCKKINIAFQRRNEISHWCLTKKDSPFYNGYFTKIWSWQMQPPEGAVFKHALFWKAFLTVNISSSSYQLPIKLQQQWTNPYISVKTYMASYQTWRKWIRIDYECITQFWPVPDAHERLIWKQSQKN